MSVDLLISSTLCDPLQAFNIFKTNTAQLIKNIPHPPQIFEGCFRSLIQISMILFSTCCWEKKFYLKKLHDGPDSSVFAFIHFQQVFQQICFQNPAAYQYSLGSFLGNPGVETSALQPCHSQCGLRTSSTDITWEQLRNEDAMAPLQTQ